MLLGNARIIRIQPRRLCGGRPRNGRRGVSRLRGREVHFGRRFSCNRPLDLDANLQDQDGINSLFGLRICTSWGPRARTGNSSTVRSFVPLVERSANPVATEPKPAPETAGYSSLEPMTPQRRKNAANASVTPERAFLGIQVLAKSGGKPARRFFMPKNSEQPASWRAFTKPTSRRAQPEESVALDFGARAQDFLKRITPLSADLAARGRTRTLALQKLHRICQAEVRTLKARYTLATVKLALSKYRERDPRRGPRPLGLASKENAFRSNASAILRSNRKKPARSRSLHPNGARTPGQRSLPPKRHGPGWPSPGAGLPRSSLALPSASLEKSSPIPPSSLTANWKTRQAPGTSFEPYLIPRSRRPQENHPGPRHWQPNNRVGGWPCAILTLQMSRP
jgi:hypothetical protein